MACLQFSILVITERSSARMPTMTDGHLGIGAELMWFGFLLSIE